MSSQKIREKSRMEFTKKTCKNIETKNTSSKFLIQKSLLNFEKTKNKHQSFLFLLKVSRYFYIELSRRHY